jgi:hypothetical protein
MANLMGTFLMFIVNMQNRVVVKKLDIDDLRDNLRNYDMRVKQVYQGLTGDR